jgi:hypothetical protein
MAYNGEYPDRVALLEPGVYGWRHAIEKEYERRSYKGLKIAAAVYSIVMLILGGGLSFQKRDWKSLAITVACVAGFLAICWLVCFFLDRLPGNMIETYEMTDKYIKPGSWKSGYRFDFKDTKEVIVTRYYIDLINGTYKPRIYVPEEDMNFVRDHILGRVPGTALVRYE